MTTEPEIHELPNTGETPGLDEALAALQRSDLTEDDALRIVVEFFDTTLRDGDQSVGNSLTLEQKKVIALLLAWAKIDTIELGFGINQADSGMDEIVALLKENSKDNIPNVASLARSKSQDIAAAKAAVKDAPQEKQRIHIFTSGSDEHIFAKFYRQFLDKEETEELDAKVDTFGNANEAREWYKSKGYIQKGRQYILNQTVTSMQLAREGYDGQIEWSAEDAVNADPKFLLQLIRNVVIYAGANGKKVVINIPDTVGRSEPREVENLMYALSIGTSSLIAEGYDFEFSFHGHDDTANAHENAKAAIRGVARAYAEKQGEVAKIQIEGCLLKVGERNGNVDIGTVIGNIENAPDTIAPNAIVTHNITTNKMYFVSQVVEKILGPNRPRPNPYYQVSGHGAGIHQDGVAKGMKIFGKDIYRPYDPKTFGTPDHRTIFGPRSGREAIIEIMQAMKVPEFADVGKNDECVNRLLETCQADVANKRWYEAANVYARWLEINGKFDFEEPEGKPTEKIQVSDHGIYVEFTLHGKKIVIENTTNQGGGSITALIRAINDKMGGTKAISVSDYSVEDRKTGLDALREVSTEVATNKCHELGILVEGKSLETLRGELASKGEHDIIPAFEGLNRENGKHQEAIGSAKLNVQGTMIHTRSHSRDSLEAGIKAIIIGLIPFFEKHINVFSTPDAEWWHKYVHGES